MILMGSRYFYRLSFVCYDFNLSFGAASIVLHYYNGLSYFQIVFSDAWWIGKKDENPDELRLDFPKELSEVGYFHIVGIL